MMRVVAISPEPTSYRAPLFDRIAARDDVDLTVGALISGVRRRALDRLEVLRAKAGGRAICAGASQELGERLL